MTTCIKYGNVKIMLRSCVLTIFFEEQFLFDFDVSDSYSENEFDSLDQNRVEKYVRKISQLMSDRTMAEKNIPLDTILTLDLDFADQIEKTKIEFLLYLGAL